MRAVGSAPGYWSRIETDPEGVAHSRLKCDPFRVWMGWREHTVGVAQGYHLLPFQGTDGFSEILRGVRGCLSFYGTRCADGIAAETFDDE
jgi:hypothetical protein